MELQKYIDLFENLEATEIYDYILELGSTYNSSVERTSNNFVHGCASSVWVEAHETPVGWDFVMDSDSYLVKGVGKIICDSLSGLTAEEISDVVWIDFADLGKYFTQQRKQGMQAILNKCKRLVLQ